LRCVCHSLSVRKETPVVPSAQHLHLIDDFLQFRPPPSPFLDVAVSLHVASAPLFRSQSFALRTKRQDFLPLPMERSALVDARSRKPVEDVETLQQGKGAFSWIIAIPQDWPHFYLKKKYLLFGEGVLVFSSDSRYAPFPRNAEELPPGDTRPFSSRRGFPKMMLGL